METVTDFIFLGSKITGDSNCSHEIKRYLLLGRKTMTNLDSILKSRDITLPAKVHTVGGWMVFPAVMCGCESWTIMKALHQRIDAFEFGAGEDSWESLGQQGDQTSYLKGNQPWIFIGRTDAKAEVPKLWPLDAKSWLTGKNPDDGKDWRQEEKGTTEDEIVGWHHLLDGHEFEKTPGDGDGQGSLVCCSPWGCEEWDTTEKLNSNNNTFNYKMSIKHLLGISHCT